MFLLDTDYAVLLQRGSSDELRRLMDRMSAYPDTDFHYPVVSFKCLGQTRTSRERSCVVS